MFIIQTIQLRKLPGDLSTAAVLIQLAKASVGILSDIFDLSTSELGPHVCYSENTFLPFE